MNTFYDDEEDDHVEMENYNSKRSDVKNDNDGRDEEHHVDKNDEAKLVMLRHIMSMKISTMLLSLLQHVNHMHLLNQSVLMVIIIMPLTNLMKKMKNMK